MNRIVRKTMWALIFGSNPTDLWDIMFDYLLKNYGITIDYRDFPKLVN